jgi:hypothetical protein
MNNVLQSIFYNSDNSLHNLLSCIDLNVNYTPHIECSQLKVIADVLFKNNKKIIKSSYGNYVGCVTRCCGAGSGVKSTYFVSKAGEVILNDSLQTLTCYMPLSDKVKTLF